MRQCRETSMKVKQRFRDDVFSFLFGSGKITAKADMKSVVPQAYCNPLAPAPPCSSRGAAPTSGSGWEDVDSAGEGQGQVKGEGHWLGHPPLTPSTPHRVIITGMTEQQAQG